MKRLILAITLMTCIGAIAQAQSSTKNSRKNSSTMNNHGAYKSNKGNQMKSNSHRDTLNNRVNYQWKNGQEATPTGNEATSTNGDRYAAMKKDTARPVRKQN
jgi:hypothetical protein